jgi:hypothetical protein
VVAVRGRRIGHGDRQGVRAPRACAPAALAARGTAPGRRPPRRSARTGPIVKVEVSLTGEGDWLPAELEPPRGPYHWQSWSFEWNANDRGRKSLRARATDAAGNTQPEVPPWNRLGYGNNAIEVVTVDVR